MTKCETRKQLSYFRLGTGISQENGGFKPGLTTRQASHLYDSP